MSNNENNPYASPSADVNTGIKSRSAIPKVIGIISLIFAVLGLIGAIGGLAATLFMPSVLEAQINIGFDKNYLLGMNILGLFTSIWAIFIGLKLMKYKDVGRRHFNYYTIITIIMSIVSYFYTKDIMKSMYTDMEPAAAEAAMDMSTITSLSAFIGPVILIIVYLLLNQKKVKENLN